MTTHLNEQLQRVKQASHALATIPNIKRDQLLLALSDTLLAETDTILKANALDLANMSEDNPQYDRLKLTAERISTIASDLKHIAQLPQPLGRILLQKTLPNGLSLKKVTVPLGVIGVIYESRPNVTIDVFSLCFKSGNACVLKGGKEALNSNQILYKLIKQALNATHLPEDAVYLMPANREAVGELLNAVGLIDICIPRGGEALINFVRSHAKIPVIETGAGIVHTYFDVSGDLNQGEKIVLNAKTRRVSVCNALDTLIIHASRLKDLPQLVKNLAEKQVIIYADTQSYESLQGHYPDDLLQPASQEDFGKEFLAYKMAIKTVDSIDEAIRHITHYSSAHSEAIIAEDRHAIDKFINNVDAAAVYVNASTAFTDGGEFGLGAEIGISTQKLHARGPMGLEELTSYKWIIEGQGHIRA